MKKMLLAAGLAVALATAGTSANAATYVVGPIVAADGSATGTFGDNFKTAGLFTSTFTFFLAKTGLFSSSITTTAVSKNTNIDFKSATVNGIAYALSPTGAFEFGNIAALPVVAGLQTIVVKGTTGKNGSFSGQFSFSPAVPEPSTWFVMLMGVAGLGAAMRRRNSLTAATAA
jgi:hypothetical protein